MLRVIPRHLSRTESCPGCDAGISGCYECQHPRREGKRHPQYHPRSIYKEDELPSLQLSTQETHTGTIENYVRPRWGAIKLSQIRAMEVKVWLDGLKIGPASKTRMRNMISIMFDRAMLWQYIPVNRNPMQLVKVKGSSKRSRGIVIITPEGVLRSSGIFLSPTT